MFKLNDICLVYDLGKEDVTYALRNVDFSTPEQGLIGIIGPSGSGKSSLLYAMAGLKVVSSGKIKYENLSVTEMSIDDKAKLRKENFGFVFQRGYLIDYLSVLDNILVPVNSNSKEYKSKAISLLESLNIAKLYKKMPNQLSGGQRQRVSIARALINNPKVVFADEPTAALDHNSAKEVMKVLSEYAKNNLVIVVTHDTSILPKDAKVVSIWDGKINTEIEEVDKN